MHRVSSHCSSSFPYHDSHFSIANIVVDGAVDNVRRVCGGIVALRGGFGAAVFETVMSTNIGRPSGTVIAHRAFKDFPTRDVRPFIGVAVGVSGSVVAFGVIAVVTSANCQIVTVSRAIFYRGIWSDLLLFL